MKSGGTDLSELLKQLKPEHNLGDFVFCTVADPSRFDMHDVIMVFKEREGHTIIVKKEFADDHGIPYSFVSAWITLTVHSSLAAVGLTASFSKALADKGISCNVVAGHYHDNIFVEKKDVDRAMNALIQLSK